MRGVEDALARLDGVKSIRVDLQSNQIFIIPSSDVELPLLLIPTTISDAGFVPDVMRIRARGRYEGTDVPYFRIRGWSEPLRVESGAVPSDGEVLVNARVDYDRDTVVLLPGK